MNLTLRSSDYFSTRLASSGDLTRSANSTPDVLVQLAGSDVYKTVVELDLSETKFINSSGFGWLLTTHKRCSACGGRLVIHSLQPQIRELFGVLKLQRIFCIVENEDDVPIFMAL